MNKEFTYDVIVVGGGHAGVEAALASARTGARTLLLTQNIETIGQMSCNPAIGGIGKGHLVKEIDALGGIMAEAADRAGIQFRTLNSRKGPAVRATRAQSDRALYRQFIRRSVENQPNLHLFQQGVDDLLVKNGQVFGCITQMGLKFYAHAVVLTVGTFLGGKIHIGLNQYSGGRAGDAPSNALSERLRELPLEVGRLKTGTPPRVDGRSVDFSKLEAQPGDIPIPSFSYLAKEDWHPRQVSCYITHTNQKTHDIIRQYLHQSPMYAGEIEGVGPRYCPSIEDKIVRFSERNSHQIFVEPEGLDNPELYPNGISTSLPFNAQIEFLQSIVGFEQARIVRPGYAIEYDFFDPRGLKPSLETKPLNNLYFAGQINGTTGYEEAAAQGLLAGLNAARSSREQEPWCPRRDEAYLGVLIDDLATLGTKEPYRMFTSRAEFRLLLREDNADLRLTEQGYKLGLVNEDRWNHFYAKKESIETEMQRLKTIWLSPENLAGKTLLQQNKIQISKENTAFDLLKRPEVSYNMLTEIDEIGPGLTNPSAREQVEIQIQYEGYIARQKEEIAKLRANEQLSLSANLNYSEVKGLSLEVIEKLNKAKPATVGQAGRISGITPAALSLLLVHLKKNKLLNEAL